MSTRWRVKSGYLTAVVVTLSGLVGATSAGELEALTAFRVDVLSPSSQVGPSSGHLDSFVLDAPPGENRVSVEVGVFLESRFKDRERGTPGWSLSVLAEHCFDVEDATVAGTAVDHYFDKGFKIVQRIDPKVPHNAGRQGVVSAVMLSRGGVVTLPPVGEELVLLIRGTVDVSSSKAPRPEPLPVWCAP